MFGRMSAVRISCLAAAGLLAVQAFEVRLVPLRGKDCAVSEPAAGGVFFCGDFDDDVLTTAPPEGTAALVVASEPPFVPAPVSRPSLHGVLSRAPPAVRA